MLPALRDGSLPPGVHDATLGEVTAVFGTTERRLELLAGLVRLLDHLTEVGCRQVFLDGSFVTAKQNPADYDLVWDLDDVDLSRLDPVLFDLEYPRAAQHAKYHGDIFPSVTEGLSNVPFVEFFQQDKETGAPRGIVCLLIGGSP